MIAFFYAYNVGGEVTRNSARSSVHAQEEVGGVGEEKAGEEDKKEDHKGDDKEESGQGENQGKERRQTQPAAGTLVSSSMSSTTKTAPKPSESASPGPLPSADLFLDRLARRKLRKGRIQPMETTNTAGVQEQRQSLPNDSMARSVDHVPMPSMAAATPMSKATAQLNLIATMGLMSIHIRKLEFGKLVTEGR